MPILYVRDFLMGMFEGIKRLLGVSSEPPVGSQQEGTVAGTFEQSVRLRPWEDQTLAPEERKGAYEDLVREKLEGIQIAFDRASEAQDVATQKKIMNSPETKKWMEEAVWLQAATAEEFCERIDRAEVIKLLGKNFLGAQAWEAQGIDVGEEPAFPGAITKSLLESECPLHPGEQIKDTHLLLLIPKTVNGEPYSALKLDELCATWKGSGARLIYEGAKDWKSYPWAWAPQAESEWVLLPKRVPDREKMPAEKHFWGKSIAEQQKVHEAHYKEYREVKTVELMTAVILNDLANGEPRMVPDAHNYLRCVEPNPFGGRVCVGCFLSDGLEVEHGDNGLADLGRALAWKS